MGRARRLLAPLAVIAAGVTGCAELTSVPTGVSALDFTGIPFPAVVTGDTMRDRDGVSAPLRATAYDSRGTIITDADIQYVALDTGVTIDANGFLIASRRDGTVRVVASIGGLQSQARTLFVTRAPDSVVTTTTDVALQYRVPDAAANVSPALALSLRSNDTAGGVSPNVAGWLVRWRIIHNGDTLAVTDTNTVALWSPSGTRHTLTDTTRADGTSSRRLRVYSNLLPLQPDSFIVIAEIRSRGVQVPGSPVRYVVNVTPPTI
jgi:hypothetical protein